MWEEKLVQTSQVRLNHAVGPDNGPALLLLHGVTRSWKDFVSILPAVTIRHRVSAIDFRGHGRSERAETYLVADYTRDVVALLRNYYNRTTILWGHSLGAMVALSVAAQAPGRVAAVILEDPPFHTMGNRLSPSLAGFFSGLKACSSDPGQSIPEVALRMSAIRMPTDVGHSIRLDEVRDPSQIRFGARCLMDLDPAVLDPILAGKWLEGYDLGELLPRVHCPVLLLAADLASGGMLIPEDADRVAQTVPDCTRVDLVGAGHLLHWQRTDEVLRHVLAFLESV